MSTRKERVRRQMERIAGNATETATTEGSGDDLAAAQESIREGESVGNAGEVAERLQRAAIDVLDPAAAPVAEPVVDQAASTSPEAAPVKRKGGWPKGKPRNSAKGSKAAAKPTPAARKVAAVKEDRTFQTPATMAARVEAAERHASELERQLAGHTSISPEEIDDLRYEIEGLLITAQAVGRQRFGEVAILTEEQTLAITRMWTRPFERALRYLAKRTDDGRVPAWVMPTVQLALATVGTIAVLFPNWMAYVDQQTAAAKLNGAERALYTDAPELTGAPATAQAEVREIPPHAMIDDDPTGAPEFARPLGTL